MLNFDKNIEEVIATQETTKRAHEFVEYNSKRKLFEASLLDEKQQNYVNQLKGTFTFHIHKGGRYLVITMYYSRDKKYGFIIVDLETLKCAQTDSIKNAKREVLEIISENEKNVETTVDEQAETTAAETIKEAQEPEEKPSKGKNK